MVSTKTPSTPGALLSNEQALNWATDLVVAVKEARVHCDKEKSPVAMKKWFQKLLVRYGSAKGALDALYRCGKLDDGAYRTLSEQALIALAVKVT